MPIHLRFHFLFQDHKATRSAMSRLEAGAGGEFFEGLPEAGQAFGGGVFVAGTHFNAEADAQVGDEVVARRILAIFPFSSAGSVVPKAGRHDLLPNPHPPQCGFWR